MSFEAEFKDDDLKKFLANFDKKLKQVKDGKKQYAALMSSIIFEDITRHFENEEGEKGKWQSWSASYAKAMQAKGMGGNKILQYNGRLRQNFKPTSHRSVKDGIIWFNDAKTAKGFPYAWFHNDGAKKKRDFMWASDKALEKMSDQTLAFILDKGI